MTSRGYKLLANDKDERVKLLTSEDLNEQTNDYPLGDNKVAKKRYRKLSDEVFDLVDVGSNVPKPPPLDQCVEAEVQPGDTLASISLKYNIPVAELKRVNNILTESHFYALKRIKIPVKAASLLTELLPAVHQAKGEAKLENGWFVREIPSPVQPGTGTSSTVPSSPPSDTEHELVQLNGHPESIIVPHNRESTPNSKQARKAKRFLKNVDKDLARIKEKLDIDNDSDDDLNNSNDASVMIRGTSVDPDQDGNVGFVDAIRASQSRTACCLFVIIISVVLIVILIFAHAEYGVIEEKHHHHFHKKPDQQTSM